MLHEEEVVAEKRAVPKERVRLDKDVEVEERTVDEEVRKEQIDVDDAAGRGRLLSDVRIIAAGDVATEGRPRAGPPA